MSGATAALDATLRAGDANEDKAASIHDLILLISHYNQALPSNNYSEAAGFNSDGSNDIADLLLLVGNSNQIGD